MYARTLIYTKKIFSLKFLYFIILPYSRYRKAIYKSSGSFSKIIPMISKKASMIPYMLTVQTKAFKRAVF